MEAGLGMPLKHAQLLFPNEAAAQAWAAGGGEARLATRGLTDELDIRLVSASGADLTAFMAGDEIKAFAAPGAAVPVPCC